MLFIYNYLLGYQQQPQNQEQKLKSQRLLKGLKALFKTLSINRLTDQTNCAALKS